MIGGFRESQSANRNRQRCQFTRLDLEVFIHAKTLNSPPIDADQLVVLIQLERARAAVQPFASEVDNKEAVTFNSHIRRTTGDADGPRREILLGSADAHSETNLAWVRPSGESTGCRPNPKCSSKLAAEQHPAAFERRSVHVGNVVTNRVQALGVDGEGGKSGVKRGG